MAEPRRIRLSYRERDVGGEVRAAPAVSDPGGFVSARHLVLLVHGYNNDRAGAEDAYRGFHARQRELDPDGRYGLGRVFAELYWPGDADWGIASFLFYPQSIGRAKTTAERLAQFLDAQLGAGGARLDIVAHSMGCRLALEVLRELEVRASPLAAARIVLMAAAVPVFMLGECAPPRRLRPAFDRMLREGARSLWSRGDVVLSFAFPFGQSIAPGEEGALPVALGHEAWIDASVPLHLGQAEDAGAGHGDYWGWNEKPPHLSRARFAAAQVSEYLRFAAAGRRRVASRPLLEASALEAREAAARRAPEWRETPAYV